LGIDQERRWQHPRRAKRHRRFEDIGDQDRIGGRKLDQKLGENLRIDFLVGQAEHGDISAPVMQGRQVGDFFATRRTPGGPVIGDNPLAAQFG